MKKAVPFALLALLSACAGHQLSTCEGPNYALNAPATLPAVWDDGNSTFLRFPGNVPIPPIFVVNDAGKEATADYTVKQGGTVMLHSVVREIRLREDDRVACIKNDAFNPLGTDPGTGTTSPDIKRDVRASR